MRKSPASVATLRSRLRITHAALEELVTIKVAADGIRTNSVIKAINVLEENAALGIDKITVTPGMHRLHEHSHIDEPGVLDRPSHLELVSSNGFSHSGSHRMASTTKKAA
jgi:hypothetical protein